GHTLAQWHVDDVDAAVKDLKSNGVVFEHYDSMPGVDWSNDVASMSDMGKAAWFKDSENNILCIDDGFPEERMD
ncbi:MAG: VOC family protein, partial [Nakamurella sp.]